MTSLHTASRADEVHVDFSAIEVPDHITTILLDLDNTCYEYEPCSVAARAAVGKAICDIIGVDIDFQTMYSEAQMTVKARIPTHGASHSRALYFQTLFEELGRTDGHIHADTLERLYWDTFFTIMKPVSGLREFLAQSARSGKTIVVISDLTTAIQCEKLRRLGIAESVDYLVTSEEAGVEKPAPAMFALALEKAGATATTTLMIGDSEEKDIAGARALNLYSILIHHEDFSPQKTL